MEIEPIISLSNISKSFPGVKALVDVNLDFYPGKVHVLLGENGAGKSTLAKIVAGVYRPDSGSVQYKGQIVQFTNPKQAINSGIAMIHQELNLLPDLTVEDNIFIGRELASKGFGILDKKQMNQEATRLLTELGISINPKSVIRDLSTGEKQMAEIVRAVSNKASIVLMDEPTSSLSETEVASLFKIIRRLKKENVAIVYVTHRLKEIEEIGDCVTIMRDGCIVTTRSVKDISEREMVSLMVGREIKNYFSKSNVEDNKVVLTVKKIACSSKLKSAAFELKQGEILGVAGLVGSGRTELLRVIFGAERMDQSEIYLDNKQVIFGSPMDAIKFGIGFVPEDRRTQGAMLNKSVKMNISLPVLRNFAPLGFVNKGTEKDLAKNYVKRMGVKTPSINSIVGNLSGGNQQKVILAKWLAANSRILLLDEPTRGIDVGAKAEIYLLMKEFTQKGGSIIMVSSELPEILGLADRIIVLREGCMTGVLNREDASEEKIMHLASATNHC